MKQEDMIRKYDMGLDSFRHPYLVEEESHEYDTNYADDPNLVVKMLNSCFHLNRKAEEHCYMIAMDAKCRILGVFEVGHGGVQMCPANSREIFQRALVCGATGIIVAHNHPSGQAKPSGDDKNVAWKLGQAGILMGIQLIDFIIVGEGNSYFSFRVEHLLDRDRVADKMNEKLGKM